MIIIHIHSAYVNTILNSLAELSVGEEETTPPRAKHTKRHTQGENSDSSDGEHYQSFQPLSMNDLVILLPCSKQINRVVLLMFFPSQMMNQWMCLHLVH